MSFDASELLNTVQNDPMSTQPLVVPEAEYQSIIQKIEIRDFQYKKGERAGQTGYALDVTHLIIDPQLEASLGRQPTVRQSMTLDMSQSGGLDTSKGKNVSLGRLREAIGLNQPGQPFSLKMLEGARLVVMVKHDMDGDNIYANVTKVRKAA